MFWEPLTSLVSEHCSSNLKRQGLGRLPVVRSSGFTGFCWCNQVCPINEPGFFSIQRADAIVRPLADDPVIFFIHGFNHRTWAAPGPVHAFILALGSPADAVVHDGAVIVGQAGDQPVGLGNPVIVGCAARLDVLVMDGDELVAVPALVFVKKAEDVAEFMRRHPFQITPPECGDVDVGALSFDESDVAGVVAGVGLTSEVDIFNFRGARDEFYLCAGVHPALHRTQSQCLLLFREPGNVVRNYAIRPRPGPGRICLYVGWIGIGGDRPGQNEREHDDDEQGGSAMTAFELRRFRYGHGGFTMRVLVQRVN